MQRIKNYFVIIYLMPFNALIFIIGFIIGLLAIITGNVGKVEFSGLENKMIWLFKNIANPLSAVLSAIIIYLLKK